MRMLLRVMKIFAKTGLIVDITSRSGVNIKYTYIILIKIEK